MQTETDTNKLNTKLLGLFLKSKQWVTEIEFFQFDLELLRKHMERNLPRLVEHGDFLGYCQSLKKIRATAIIQADLKVRIIEYRKALEPPIALSKPARFLSSIESYHRFELELANILVRLGKIKTLVFNLTGKGLNARNILLPAVS
jgi:hypothetical protein